MKNRGLIIAGLVCGLALLVGGVLWSADPGVWEQRLPDGSLLVLRGVSYGKQHRLGVGNMLQRVGGRLLPEPLAKRLGITVLTHSNSVPDLVVWLEHRQQTSASRRPAGGYLATPVIVSDDAGTEFEQNGSSFATQGTNYLIEGYTFGCFPGASRMVHIEARPANYEKKTSFEGHFRVRNPVYSARPPAPKTAYPVRTEKEGLVFELEHFRPSKPPRSGPAGSTPKPAAWMELGYRIEDTSSPERKWFVRGITVRDDSGGAYRPSATSSPAYGGGTNFAFRGGLNTNLAWTLELKMARSTYESNELFTVKDVPLGGRDAGTNFWPPVSTQLQGVTLTVEGFRRRRGYVFAGFSPPTEGLRLELIRITDDLGNEGRVTVTGVSGGSNYHFGVNVSSNASSANLTFALGRDREMEVKARPGGGGN